MRFMPALALGVMVPVAGAVMLAAPAAAAKKDDAAAAAAPKVAPSQAFLKIYLDADKTLKAGDIAGAKAKAADAEKAVSTPDDKYVYGNLLLNIGVASKEEDQQKAGLEMMLASGKVAPADAAKFSFFLGQFAMKAKNYDESIKDFGAAAAAGYSPATSYALTAESYFGKATDTAQGNQLTPAGKQIAQQGLDALKKAVDAQAASGQPVDKGWYSRGFQMAALSSSPDITYWSSAALKADPSPENWRIALRVYQDGHKLTLPENLDLFRLMAVTNSLKDAYSYGEYTDDAMKRGLYGEVKTAVEKGRASGVLNQTQLAESYKAAVDGAAKDKASLPASEDRARKAATGDIAAATAEAYLGYGDYAKAVALYRLALQKGGVDANETNTRLGIALTLSGDMAGAKTAFAAVQTGNRKDIADFWTLYLGTKGA